MGNSKDNTHTPVALIVDDERDIRDLLSMTLSRMGIIVETAADLASAKLALSQRSFDLCLTDMKLPDGSGQTLIELIASMYPHTPVAMITAHGDVDAAVEALKAGAFDFVSKPVDVKYLRQMARNALELQHKQSSEPDESETGFSRPFIGESPVMNQLRNTIKKLARSQAPVCIGGESGVGKELVARLIHEHSPRREKPFIAVNCGAIPTELMESEFFGHKKGSFTGAVSDKEGLFASATEGTLFLDEVAELPLHMQVKLLRVIQEKTVRPIGATQEQDIDVRILSATHKDLADLIERGDFRHDLYYRINVIELRVPALRERGEDIVLLAQHVLAALGEDMGHGSFELAPDALEALRHYPFPGNVRELQNVLERAVALSDGHILHADDLHLPSHEQHGDDPLVSRSVMTGDASTFEGELDDDDWQVDDALVPSLPEGEGLTEFMEQVERDVIMQALEASKYNKTKAAAKLGITFRALRYKLKKLDIE